jgi:drug/metabolite transporter (DMT)-like permease
MISLRQNLRAAGMLSLTMALFCCGDTLSKLILQRLPVGELTFIRGVLVCLLILAVQLARGQGRRLGTGLERTTLLRALVEAGVVLAFFSALRSLPVANATTLMFTSPIVMTGLVAFVLKEPVGPRRWAAVIVGFLGVLLVASPSREGWNPAALFALLGAFLVAVRDLMTRFIPGSVDPGSVALTTSVVVTILSAPSVLLGWVVPQPRDLALIAAAAVLLAIAYSTIVLAFRGGETSFIAPFRYLSIPLAILLGWLVFGDVPRWNMLAGAAVIIGSGAFIFYRERAVARRRPATA